MSRKCRTWHVNYCIINYIVYYASSTFDPKLLTLNTTLHPGRIKKYECVISMIILLKYVETVFEMFACHWSNQCKEIYRKKMFLGLQLETNNGKLQVIRVSCYTTDESDMSYIISLKIPFDKSDLTHYCRKATICSCPDIYFHQLRWSIRKPAHVQFK